MHQGFTGPPPAAPGLAWPQEAVAIHGLGHGTRFWRCLRPCDVSSGWDKGTEGTALPCTDPVTAQEALHTSGSPWALPGLLPSHRRDPLQPPSACCQECETQFPSILTSAGCEFPRDPNRRSIGLRGERVHGAGVTETGQAGPGNGFLRGPYRVGAKGTYSTLTSLTPICGS